VFETTAAGIYQESKGEPKKQKGRERERRERENPKRDRIYVKLGGL